MAVPTKEAPKRRAPTESSTATRSTRPSSCRRCSRSVFARAARGTLRHGLCGASAGAGWWSARRNCPRATAVGAGSRGGASSALSPGNQGTTDHDHGNPKPGRPTRSGTGTGRGNPGDSRGSHRCSCSISAAETARRGTRTASSSPKRNSLLSQPSPISFSASCARSGCCSWSSARTNDGSMATSAGGLAPSAMSPALSLHTVHEPTVRPPV